MKNIKLLLLLSTILFSIIPADIDFQRAQSQSMKTFVAEQAERDAVETAKRENLKDLELKQQTDLAKALSIAEQEKLAAERKSVLEIVPVLAQENSDCFYHALKNGLFVYKWQTNQIDEKSCKESLKSTNSIVFPLEYWRQLTIAKFQQGANLSDAAGEYLLKVVKLTNNTCTIISNLSELVDFTKQPKQNLSMLDQNLADLINEFRSSENKVHIFILGSMRHIEHPVTKKIIPTFGHWVSIVAAKKKHKITYYAMDSLIDSELKKFHEQFKYLLEDSKLS